MNTENFSGVFEFTNASEEDFITLWNNKEYVFPANTTCPLIIPNESLENIQEIRKRFALKYAQREFAKSKDGVKIEKEASKYFSPATYNEAIYQPYINQCLTPLPKSSAKIKDIPKAEIVLNGTAVITDKGGVNALSAADGVFKDYTPPELGAMN